MARCARFRPGTGQAFHVARRQPGRRPVAVTADRGVGFPARSCSRLSATSRVCLASCRFVLQSASARRFRCGSRNFRRQGSRRKEETGTRWPAGAMSFVCRATCPARGSPPCRLPALADGRRFRPDRGTATSGLGLPIVRERYDAIRCRMRHSEPFGWSTPDGQGRSGTASNISGN